MDAPLLIEEAGEGVLLLTLNRPAQRNAIDLDLCDALLAALARFRDEDRWRAAILTGQPPAFCAGMDLKAFSAPDAPRHRVTELIHSLPSLGKPIIAAVNGAAYTGGLELALACDFILAGEGARFADTHAKIGALSGSGMGSRLPHAVGLRFAKQMMLACQPIDAATALRVGLVNEVLPADRLLPRAIELATAIAGHDRELVRLARDVLDRGSAATLGEAIAIEREALAKRKAEGAMRWEAGIPPKASC
ncbi:enoyl-CoA hydratase-related protein [Rhizorhabdus dicambivorans]|uniref:Enoyl-CoA hydratase n=1 Tax=Rhizorhabdus dicambivorans TaxID=1850238 RepID=A0A2A4FN49_9SPHN|nr:enoyl-CoA hydratase-related protein [Rhizorhabdus dicambivorans]ATE63985.1 enoyl-CoA hydratase [Rhizorhabdus dicambivorans]PCE40185.1 enoyl-CoA hydratase [Rhizorhabdus dicambivorans]